MGYTETLAAFAVDLDGSKLSDELLHAARRCVLDWMGVALGGSQHPVVEKSLAVLEQLGGRPQATIVGRGRKESVVWSALVNGMMAHVLDFDDTHLETILHPTAPILSAGMAVAEWKHLSGRTLLESYIVGYEVGARVALFVNPAHYDVGFHVTGTAGAVGAAAMAGRLLGLDHETMTYALGIAASSAMALREMFGTMTKSYHPGRAAQSGVMAALLAAEGFTSSTRSLEAERGYGFVLSSERHLERLVEGLGERFEILVNSFKPYPCGVVTHPGIDAVIQLREEHGLRVEDIASVELRVNAHVLELCGKTAPRTGLEGKFSMYHCAAVGLIDGVVTPRQFSDERVRDAQVVALRGRVRLVADEQIREDEAVAIVELASGQTHRKHVPHATGSIENPFSDAGLRRKFHSLADPQAGAARAEQIVALVDRLESLPDVGELMALL